MNKRIQWDIYEAVLLVDVYFQFQKIELERKHIVEMLSHELRNKAINAGIKIDDVFRNMNGINMRLYELLYIDTNGEKGMKNTSKLFKDMMEMYRNCNEHFCTLCTKAYNMVEIDEQTQCFLQWLELCETKQNVSEIRMALRILNYFEWKGKILQGRLAHITDFDMLETIKDNVINANSLKLHLSVLDCVGKLLNTYEIFLKSNDKKIGGLYLMEKDNDEKAKMFLGWLTNKLHLAVTTARGYSSAINTATPYVEKICGISTSLYCIDDVDELEKILAKLIHSEEFKEVNEHSHNRFRGAFDKYLHYRKTLSGEEEYESFLKKDDEGIFENIEDIIREADIDGITAEDISGKIGKSSWLINKYLKDKGYAIEVPGNLYIHADNIVDLFENRDTLERILRNQFNKFYGYTNDVVLYDAALISLSMFLNDNCIDTPEKVYAVARYLFEKVEKSFVFAADKHIWEKTPNFSFTHAGIVKSYIDKNGGKVSRTQCVEYLQRVKLPSTNINGILSIANGKDVLLSEHEEYVLSEYIIENDDWLNRVKEAIEKLFNNESYVIPREINDGWFEMLPNLYGGLSWNLLLFQEIIKKFLPEYRLITANENQGLETIRAGIVREDSVIGNFADLVHARLIDESSIELPVRMNKEELRQLLIEYKMIQGSELIYTMPKALESSKFAWSSDEESVLILN